MSDRLMDLVMRLEGEIKLGEEAVVIIYATKDDVQVAARGLVDQTDVRKVLQKAIISVDFGGAEKEII